MVKLQSKPGVVTSGVRWYHRLKESQIKVKHCPGPKATLTEMKVPCGSFACHSTLSNVPVCWKSVNTGALARVWISLVRVTHTWRSHWPSNWAGSESLGTRHPRKLFPASVYPAAYKLTMMWSE